MLRPLLIALALAAAPACAHAARICAWMTETAGEDDLHEVELWLEADQDLDIFYQIAGQGFLGDGSRMHSPGSGTFVLHAGRPEKPWGFGATLSPPGDIDIVAEIHKTPADIFSEEPKPLLASFSFQRHLPEGETTPPKDLAAKQCAAVTP